MIVECINDIWYNSYGKRATKNLPIKGNLYNVIDEVKDIDGHFYELQEFEGFFISRSFRKVDIDITEVTEILKEPVEILV